MGKCRQDTVYDRHTGAGANVVLHIDEDIHELLVSAQKAYPLTDDSHHFKEPVSHHRAL